ncbi:MAG: transcriptional regulator, AraC family [Clostridia bacterium]|jgi:AraC-like DNA-binding protein|nr:transcriptional regulator, AraC family [Clostridia bacterium]
MNRIVSSGMVDGLVIDRVIRDQEFTMPTKHFHSEYEIYYLLEGSRYYFIENETYLIKKGSLVLIKPHQIHKTGSSGNSYHDRILLELNDAPFTSFFSSLSHLSIKEFFAEHAGVLELDETAQNYVESLLFDILEETHKKVLNYEAMVTLKLSELLLYTIRFKNEKSKLPKAATANTAKHNKVHEVAHYIAENYSKANSLDDLSRRFYVSKCYLSRIFKEVTGFTLNEYINIHRIKQAQELLVNSNYNITEIAETLGYDSITYFERVFKKYAETSPLKYRKKFLLINQKTRERKNEKGLSN